VEQAFGVLQAHWESIKNPCKAMEVEDHHKYHDVLHYIAQHDNLG
jgi:hypothetical protein